MFGWNWHWSILCVLIHMKGILVVCSHGGGHVLIQDKGWSAEDFFFFIVRYHFCNHNLLEGHLRLQITAFVTQSSSVAWTWTKWMLCLLFWHNYSHSRNVFFQLPVPITSLFLTVWELSSSERWLRQEQVSRGGEETGLGKVREAKWKGGERRQGVSLTHTSLVSGPQVWHRPAVSSTWWVPCRFAVSPRMLVLRSCHGFSPSSFWWLALVVYFWVISVPTWFHVMACLFFQVGFPKNEQTTAHDLSGPPAPVLGGELQGAPAFCLQLACTFLGLLETSSPPHSIWWEEINLRWYSILFPLQQPIYGQLRNRKKNLLLLGDTEGMG